MRVDYKRKSNHFYRNPAVEFQQTLENTSQQAQYASPVGESLLEGLSRQLDNDVQQAGSRHEALELIAKSLVTHTNAGVAIRLVFDSDKRDTEPFAKIETLASKYAKVPANIEQWATALGLKSLVSGQWQRETSNDTIGKLIHLFAVPFSGESGQAAEVIACLFFEGTNDHVAEEAALLLAQNHFAQWEMLDQVRNVGGVAQHLSAVSELVSRMESADSLDSGCKRLANELNEHVVRLHKLGSDESPDICRVYIGVTDRKNQSLEMVAISNSDSIDRNSQLVEFAEAAMRECICREEITVWPAKQESRQSLLCHKQFANFSGQTVLVTMPLFDIDGTTQGCILLSSEVELSSEAIRFVQGCALQVAVSMQLLRRATKSKLLTMLDRTLESLKKGRIKTVAKVVAAVVGLSLIPLPYNVSSTVEVRPSMERFVAAPFDGQLKTCFAKPGEEVAGGQVIAILDGREINLELASIEAELHGANKLRDGHVAAHESGEARIAQHEAERLQARYDLLKYRSENLELKSPIAGVVISEDLKTAEGMPVETGQALFEVAPLGDLLLELAIPEDDVRFVEPGMKVVVRLNAFPFESWNGSIENVHPASELKDEKNVFVAKVLIPNVDGRLRPGMQGHAKIKTVWRPVGWNILHRPVAHCLRWCGW